VAIYDNIISLINSAIGDTSSAASDLDYNPPPVSLPAVEFSADAFGPTVPENPTFSPSAPPRTTMLGSMNRASYNAASSVVGAISVPPIPTTLSYQAPVHPDALPNYGQPDYVDQPPEAGFLTIEDSAGLETVPAPVVEVGTPPVLQPIPQLSYTTYGFEKLDAELPVPSEVPTAEQLSNPEQLIVQVEPQLLAAIQQTLSGQDILPIQENLYRMATHDARRERVDAERKAFALEAAAGFSESTGGLFERIANINYASSLQDGAEYEKGRDFIYETAKEKLVVAVQQSIALETANFAVHLSYASKLIEVFEINVAMHIELFNTLVDMYTTQLQGVNELIAAYNTYIGVVLAENSAELAELEVSKAVLQTNRAAVKMYQAQSETAGVRATIYGTTVEQDTLPIDEYTTYIDGQLQNIALVKLNISAYKEALSAYSSAAKLDKSVVDAYGAQVRAEGSAIDVYKENWDLYGTAYSTLGGQNNSIGEFNRASFQALTSEIGVFRSPIDEQRSYLRGLSTWVTERGGAVRGHTQAAKEMSTFMQGKSDTIVALEDANVRVELANADLDSTQSALDAQRIAAQAAVDAGLLASNATTYSGLAQSAYSIRSISASLGSFSTDSDGKTFSSSATEGNSYTRSYAYSKSLPY
jgi:tetratricopeptide (TPR) repeat protein